MFDLLVLAGATFLLRSSRITEPIRQWLKRWSFFDRLLSCAFCTGIWVGAAVWGVKLDWWTVQPSVRLIVECGETALVGGAASYLFDEVLLCLDRYHHNA